MTGVLADGPDDAAVAIIQVGTRELLVDLILHPGACVSLQPGSIAASAARTPYRAKVRHIATAE